METKTIKTRRYFHESRLPEVFFLIGNEIFTGFLGKIEAFFQKRLSEPFWCPLHHMRDRNLISATPRVFRGAFEKETIFSKVFISVCFAVKAVWNYGISQKVV